MTVPVPASQQLGETVLEMIELQIDWQTSESGEGVPVWEWPKAQAALAELVSLAARTEEAEATLRRLVRLKDGSRGDEYHASKEEAWEAARALVGEPS